MLLSHLILPFDVELMTVSLFSLLSSIYSFINNMVQSLYTICCHVSNAVNKNIFAWLWIDFDLIYTKISHIDVIKKVRNKYNF